MNARSQAQAAGPRGFWALLAEAKTSVAPEGRSEIDVTPLVDEQARVAGHRDHDVLAVVGLATVMRPARQVDRHAARDHRRHHHEDDQEHQHHVGSTKVPRIEQVDALSRRLAERLRGGRQKVVFFKAEDDALYGEVVRLLDIARGSGAASLAVITE